MMAYQGILAVFALTFVVSTNAEYHCNQPLQVMNGGQVVLRKYYCNQTIDQTLLQDEPEIYYNHNLLLENRYTLFFLETNHDMKTYTMHWLLTNIIPMDSSLTKNKTTLLDYIPPRNENITAYRVLLCSHAVDFKLPKPTHLEKVAFIPERWFDLHGKNVSLKFDFNFYVRGRNTSREIPTTVSDSSTTVHTHFSHQTQTPSTLPASMPVTQTPEVTHRPRTHAPTEMVITNSPGYHFYNTTDLTNSSTTHTSSPTPDKKSLANSNVFSVAVIIIPVISVVLNVFV